MRDTENTNSNEDHFPNNENPKQTKKLKTATGGTRENRPFEMVDRIILWSIWASKVGLVSFDNSWNNRTYPKY